MKDWQIRLAGGEETRQHQRRRSRRKPLVGLVLILAAIWLSGCGLLAGQAAPTPGRTVTISTETPVPTRMATPTEASQPTPMEPTLAISPTVGPPGTEIDVRGEGFPAETEVELAVGREGEAHDFFYDAVTDPDGSLTTTLLVPPSLEPEGQVVAVAAAEEGTVRAVSNVFQLIPKEYQGSVTIQPTSGPPGTVVQVRGHDFPPSTEVDIGVGRVNSEYDVIGTASTDTDGRVETEITIPGFVSPDDRWVIVVAAAHRPAKAISSEFDVTAGPLPTSIGEGTTTAVDIHLIALGDAGQSGKEIGCNDSVVPVEVEIEPTNTPLTAALDELLAIDSRDYGQSGLYNALYQSDLRLESVDLSNGKAVIRLSGMLRLGGVCDEPRVEAQLRETALQFPGINDVSILVNGTPLGQ